MNFKNAIFDMDGTLIDSMPIWRSTQLNVIEDIYGVKFTAEQREELVYLTYGGLLNRASEIHGIEIVQRDVSIKANDIMKNTYLNGKIELKPYVSEYLSYLKNKGTGIALATATERAICIPFLKNAEIYQYFDCIYTTADDAKIGKHRSPKVYDLALEALGGTKDDTVVFEEVLVCMQTCKSNGYRVIAVHDEYQKYTKAEILATADKFINSYSEMMI